MGFFDFFTSKESVQQPDIKFGRYSDTHKEEDRYRCWDRSVQLFERGKFLDSFDFFLQYLTNFEGDNVIFSKLEDEINFEIYQGSKIIVGKAKGGKVVAQSKIAKTSALHIGFLRKLVEMNFGLKYARYALDENSTITMVFETKIAEASPFKLYAAFKELALGADKQDDVLLEEFNQLEAINMGHIDELHSDVKHVKYKFFKSTLQDVLDLIDTTSLDTLKYPGAISYLLLDKVYTLIYLLNAKGYTTDILERIHTTFFEEKQLTATVKNQRIIKELKKLQHREEADFSEELYQIKSTFGVTTPSSHSRLVNFIRGELKNMQWYETNRHKAVCEAIPGYIVGYCLFSYGLPPPDKDFLHLYYLIHYSSYFKELGFQYAFRKNRKLDKYAIVSHLKEIEKNYKRENWDIQMNYKTLDFRDNVSFAKTYLTMLAQSSVKEKRKP